MVELGDSLLSKDYPWLANRRKNINISKKNSLMQQQFVYWTQILNKMMKAEMDKTTPMGINPNKINNQIVVKNYQMMSDKL